MSTKSIKQLTKQLTRQLTKQQRYDKAHMSSAMCYATLSFAKRKKTGALLVSPDNRPLSCGFNGTSPGADNNCE